MYYWVNQGKTYKEEKEGGYLWAPIKNKNGNSFFYWDNMTKLQVGDVVFNYKKGSVVGYCIVKSQSFLAPIPKEFKVDVEWENEGYMVDADYFLFDTPINAVEVYNALRNLLPQKYSPLNSSDSLTEVKVRANQGYLYLLSNEIGLEMNRLANIKIETKFINNDKKSDYKVPDVTSRTGLVTSRVGQGEYRRRILKRWKNKCAVTGCEISEILIASHIVPWRESNNKERLDVENGLLLSPAYDALFDRHLISFSDTGELIFSKSINKKELRKIGVSGSEKIEQLTTGNLKYLKRHRAKL